MTAEIYGKDDLCNAGVSPAVVRASCPRRTGGETPPRTAGETPAVPSRLRAGVSRPRYGHVTIRDRGRLPHWETEGGVYFVTFRLADSLLRSVVEEYRVKRQQILDRAKRQELSSAERKRLARLFSERIDAYLDAGSGQCYLARPEIASVIANALRHFDQQRYRLFAWCIMPNHVHVVFRPLPGHELAAILHSWKSFTAKAANSVLDRKGSFWEREYYDHLIRDEDEFQWIVEYVLDNPKKANLRDWEWVWCGRVCRQDADTTAGEMPAVQ